MFFFNRLLNMSYRQKVPKIIKSLVKAGCVFTLVATVVSDGWSNTDHHLVVLEARPLEQIIESELQSKRFAEQIASYNGIAAVTTIIPSGTTILIPNPFLLGRNFGQVVYAKGDVVHTQKRQVANPPAKGAYVYKGDTFSTGEDGFVSLKFSSSSVVNLQPDSSVSVKEIDCLDETVDCVIALHAEKGVIDSQVTPRPAGQPQVDYSITTPFLSAAVRGTAFYVTVDKDSDKIGVTEGLVSAAVEDNTNELPKGKGLLVEANVEPELVDLLDAPELIATADDAIFSEEDVLRWKPLDDAQQYRLTIAEDESLSTPIRTSVTQRSSAFLPDGLSPGEAYLSVAGIDSQEFVGLPSSIRFNYAEIDDQEKLELEIIRSDDVVTISPIDFSGSVEILIHEGFNTPTGGRRLMSSLSDGLTFQLDPAREWSIKARKVFSSKSVSVYSSEYRLQAQK